MWRWSGPTAQVRLFFFREFDVLFSNAIPFFIGATLVLTTLLSWRLWLVAAMLTALTLALAFTPASKPLLVVTLPIVVIQIGRECRWDLSRLGDYSYGLYLWGFVVEQTVVNYIADPRTDWLVFSDCRAGVRDGSHFLAPRRKTRASLEATTP
jgi:peptidoglycan/LPS O-acetylase OafA/YrhL